jgi:subtilisin family serine protease
MSNWFLRESKVCGSCVLVNAATLAVCLTAVSSALGQSASTHFARSQRSSTSQTNQRLVFKDAQVRPREVLVRFRNTLTIQGIETIIRVLPNVDVVERIGGVPNLYRIHSRTRSVKNLLDSLSRYVDKEVLYAEPNLIIRVDGDPNDLDFQNQWGLKNTGTNLPQVPGIAGQDVSAILAWNLFTNMLVGSRSIVTGVIDTGIDYNHRDLRNNIWKAPSNYKVSVGGREVQCDQGTHGYDFVNNDCFSLDDNDHGTRVAGIIGAEGDNEFGMVGLNWAASMLAIKAFNDQGVGDAATAANAVEFAVQLKNFFRDRCDVRVLNNSYGWYLNDCSSCQSLRDQIEIARESGILFVASAGNDGVPTEIGQRQHFPSGFGTSNIISVGAFDNSGLFASFSNFGATSVHLAAPGQDIYSTVRNNDFSFGNGTSWAAPFVSGAAALTLARCPGLNTADLKAAILNNVDKVTSWSNRPIATSGRLNVYRTLTSCKP